MFCEKCGKEIPDNAKFCSGCGNTIGNSTSHGSPDVKAERAAVEKKKSPFPFIIAGVAMAVVAFFLVIVVTGIIIFSSPQRKYDKQLSLGQRYLDELDYDKAIAAYKAAIEIDPHNPEAYEALAKIYMETEEVELAKAVLDEGISKAESAQLEELLREWEAENGETNATAEDTETSSHDDDETVAEQSSGTDTTVDAGTDDTENDNGEETSDGVGLDEGYKMAIDQYLEESGIKNGMPDYGNNLTFNVYYFADDPNPSISLCVAEDYFMLWYPDNSEVKSFGGQGDIYWQPSNQYFCVHKEDFDSGTGVVINHDTIYSYPTLEVMAWGERYYNNETLEEWFNWNGQDVRFLEYEASIKSYFGDVEPETGGDIYTYNELMDFLSE